MTRNAARHMDTVVHPHARVVAKRWHLPESRLAYLDDPDQIEEMAEIMVRHRNQARRLRQRVYWALFYGGTGVLLLTGLLVSVVLIAVAILWLTVLVGIGLLFLKPVD